MTAKNDDDKRSGPSPLRRNWIWFSCQMLAQVVFTIWFRARTRGLENLPERGGVLLLMNHQSFLDPLVVGVWMNRPISYLARDSLFRVPVLGWLLRHTYVTPINRSGGSSAVIRQAIEQLEQGFLVGIFPEGTRSSDGKLGRLKPGFLAIVRRTDVPVIPVGIAGTERALGRGCWFPKPRRVRVVIGKPIPPQELTELSEKERKDEMLDVVAARINDCRTMAEAWPAVQTE